MTTKKPVVGVIGSAHLAEGKFPAQRVSERILRAAAEVAGALPLIFAGSPEIIDIGALLDTVDGVLLTGARANVHPRHFGHDDNPRHEPYDEPRDALALPLIEACVARGVPLFGICRGFQEINVAFGGTLHPEIRELPGRMNHRALRLDNGEINPDPEVIYAERHEVRLTPGGVFAKILGAETIRVNSLHGQGILEGRRPRRHRRRGRGRHHRGHPHRRRQELCARRAMACRARRRPQSGQSHDV